MFFSANFVAKSALIFHEGIDDHNRKYLALQLFEKTFDEFNPEETFGDARPSSAPYDVILFNDGKYAVY